MLVDIKSHEFHGKLEVGWALTCSSWRIDIVEYDTSWKVSVHNT